MQELAESLLIKPVLPLSWSLSRHKLFTFCRRAYFYHYYGAQSGWDENAPRDIQWLYLLKKLTRSGDWIQDIFIKSVRYSFAYAHCNSKYELMRSIKRHSYTMFSREFDDLIEGIDQRQFFELYYQRITDISTFRESLYQKLSAAIDQFVRSALFDELSEVHYFQWKLTESPDYAYIHGIQVWLSPSLTWQNERRYNCLNITTSSSHEFRALAMDLDAIYLMQRFHVAEERIECRDFCYNCESCFIEHGVVDINLIEKALGESITQMRLLYRDDGFVDEADFERTCDESKCQVCPFYAYCHR